MDGIIIAFGVLLGLSLLGLVLWYARRREQERLAVWAEVARRRGGVLHEPSGGLLSRKPHRIEVDVGSARVLGDTYVVSSGKSSTTYTRVRAHFALPVGPVFRVYREGVLSSLGKALGTQDVVLGASPAFDAAFMVKCDDPGAARQVWAPEAQQIMLRHFERCSVRSDGEVVTLVGLGAWRDAVRLDQALELVGQLAGADLFGEAALQAVPGASYEPPSGSWNQRSGPRARVVVQATEVVLEPALAPGRFAVTMARARPSRRLPACQVEIDAQGQPRGDVPQGLLDAGSAPLLHAIGHSVLRCGDAMVSLTWQQVQRDPTALMAGARLLATLSAAGQRGLYR